MELDGAQYLGFRLPFTITQLVWIEAILVGGAEVYRNREREPEKRLYPGKLSCSACGIPWTLFEASGCKCLSLLGHLQCC